MKEGIPDLLIALTRNLASATRSYEWWDMLATCSTGEKLYPLTEIWGELRFLSHIPQSGASITLSWGVEERIMDQEPQTLAILTQI